MSYLLCSLFAGLFFVIVYRLGLHDGQRTAAGKEIQNVNPIDPIVRAYQSNKAAKEIDKVNEGWANIMAYDGTPPKGAET